MGVKYRKGMYRWTFVFLVVFVIFACPQSVLAKSGMIKLKTNKTYTKYDITGDGKADRIRVTTTKRSNYGIYDTLAVVINRRIAYSFKNKYFFADENTGVDVILCTLENGKPFLYLYAQENNGDGPVCGVFQYKNGKLKEIINCQNFFSTYGSHQNGTIVSVKGNCITIRYYVMSFVLGPTYVKYDYIYKNGSLCRKSNTVNIEKVYAGGKITKVFVVNKKLTTYKSVSGKTKAYTLKKGEVVLVDKCYCNGKSLWVRLKYKGKYGWLKAVNGYKGENNKQFSNVTYAG